MHMGGEGMRKVNEFRYLVTVLSKHGEMDREIIERVVKGCHVVSYNHLHVLKGRNIPMDVKRGLRSSNLLPHQETCVRNRTTIKNAYHGNGLYERHVE